MQLLILNEEDMVVARKYVLHSHFHGLPKREDFEIVEEVLPELKDGGWCQHKLLLHESFSDDNLMSRKH